MKIRDLLHMRFLESEPVEQDLREAVILPAAGAKAGRWDVTLLTFGRSKRAPHFVYTKEAAEKSLEVFKGARVYALEKPDDFGHADDPSKKRTRDIAGMVVDPFVTDTELKGSIVLLPTAQWLRDNLTFAEEQKIPMPYELSIDAGGKVIREGEQLVVQQITHASVDVVERGAAGGRFVKLVASLNPTQQHHQEESTMNIKAKLAFLFTLLYPAFLESNKIELPKVNENELYTYLREADKTQSRLHLPDGFTEANVDAAIGVVQSQLKESKDAFAPGLLRQLAEILAKKPDADPAKIQFDADADRRLKESERAVNEMRLAACGTILEAKLMESRLPSPMKEHIRKQFTGKLFKTEDLDGSIKEIRDTVNRMIESVPDNRGLDIRLGMEDTDKVRLGVLGFFVDDQNSFQPLKESERKEILKGIPAFRSLKEMYIAVTGDVNVTGERRHSRLTESMQTSDWPNIILDAMNKRLVRDYESLGLDSWRSFVDVVPVSNFMTQYRVRYGGYANLPIRAEGQPYMPLTSPTDEKASYVPATRGGTEDLTREMIMNDDVKAARNIPQALAKAAGQTLHEFVYAFIDPAVNAVIYDTAVLYITAGGFPHANYGTAALDATGLAAARLRMKKQVRKDNAKRLGLRAGYLIVPSDLEATADGLLTPAAGKYNNVPDFLQKQNIAPIVVDYWTDATNWVLVARRESCVGLEIGFINGQETPELFVSDLANVGSYFTNDKITYKVRHEYGGAIIDFRAFDGSVVGG